MTQRENFLRTIRFERPDCIPVGFVVNPSTFYAYDPHAIEELLESHPIIGGKEKMRWDLVEQKQENYREYRTDKFRVEWMHIQQGVQGVVCKHPLEDFSKIKDYRFPELPVFDVKKKVLMLQMYRMPATLWALNCLMAIPFCG